MESRPGIGDLVAFLLGEKTPGMALPLAARCPRSRSGLFLSMVDLVIVSFVLIWAAVIVRSFETDTEETVPAEAVKAARRGVPGRRARRAGRDPRPRDDIRQPGPGAPEALMGRSGPLSSGATAEVLSSSLSERLHPGLNLGGTDPGSHRAAEEVLFGFWIFLMSDLVLFAGAVRNLCRDERPGHCRGPAPAEVFDLTAAFIETLLLLFSSFAFGFAMLAMKYRENRRSVLSWLLVTGVLGAAFVGMELHDYYVMVTEHAAPPRGERLPVGLLPP